MGGVHELSRAIVSVGVVWAIVHGIVRIVNGPVGRAVTRLITGEETAVDGESLEVLRGRVGELASRLEVAEKQIARERTPLLK
jgi:hypothetical protein